MEDQVMGTTEAQRKSERRLVMPWSDNGKEVNLMFAIGKFIRISTKDFKNATIRMMSGELTDVRLPRKSKNLDVIKFEVEEGLRKFFAPVASLFKGPKLVGVRDCGNPRRLKWLRMGARIHHADLGGLGRLTVEISREDVAKITVRGELFSGLIAEHPVPPGVETSMEMCKASAEFAVAMVFREFAPLFE